MSSKWGSARHKLDVLERTAGLIQPTVLLPAAMRASFTEVMTDAKMGADADVPPERVNLPLSATTIGHLMNRLFNDTVCAIKTWTHTHWQQRRGNPDRIG